MNSIPGNSQRDDGNDHEWEKGINDISIFVFSSFDQNLSILEAVIFYVEKSGYFW